VSNIDPTRLDLRPPLGLTPGLPFTFPFGASGSFLATGTGANKIDSDTSLWAKGTPTENTQVANTFSATWVTGYSVLDSIKGYLFTSQMIAGQAPGPGANDAANAFHGFGMATGVTYSHPGRTRGSGSLADVPNTATYVFANQTLSDGSGPPGNHSFQVGPIEQITTAMWPQRSGWTHGIGGNGRMYDRATSAVIPVVYDTAIGTHRSIKSNSEAACVAFASQVCLPSGGNGKQWGDAHDTIYNVTLGASAFGIQVHPDHSSKGTLNSGMAARFNVPANFIDPCHWAVNVYAQGHHQFGRPPEPTDSLDVIPGPLMADNPSSPPGMAKAGLTITPAGSWNTYEHFGMNFVNWMQPEETAHTLAIREPLDGTEVVHELGPANLGNHAVMDACGLIGYEGVFTVSSFYAISKDAARGGGVAPFSYANGMRFAGLNIQVTSASPARRGSHTWTGSGITGTRYGSDGAYVRPMSDCMKTTGSMKDHAGAIGLTADTGGGDSNATTFFIGRTGLDRMATIAADETKVCTTPEGDVETTISTNCTQYIIGDTAALPAAFGSANTYIGTSATVGTERVGTRWMADYMPTRVRVIPQVIGYTEETVAPGSHKTGRYTKTDAAHPAAASSIVVKRPIVDYHVLVSLCEATGTITGEVVDDVSTRNAPEYTELHQDTNTNGRDAVIMHAIFRIYPDALDQVVHGVEVAGDFGNPSFTDPEWFMQMGYDQVVPRHDYAKSNSSQQGWGLHQVTPFRPIRNQEWTNVPRFSGIVEPGGMYQRGGIEHLWDADVFGDELFVAANLRYSDDIGGGVPTVDPTTGKQWFGNVWKFGQTWNDITTPEIPPGHELMVFRYNYTQDPDHPGKVHTTPTDNPILTRLTAGNAASYLSGAFDQQLHNDRHTSHSGGFHWRSETDIKTESTSGRAWDLHDWVFPRVELMRYLGADSKGSPSTYPTISCGALRIMEDGKLLMAAVHRDTISSTDQYPDGTIGYPFDPDNAYPRCPPGYYYDGSACVAMTSTNVAPDPGTYLDADATWGISGSAWATPVSPPTASAPSNTGSTVYGQWPTWSKLVTGSSARSLVLLWTDTLAQNGKVTQGRRDFSGKWASDHAGGWVWSQVFNLPDTWWSGAQIAYWYPESGQRAIPCNYGVYPEVRLSHVTLPRSLPWITPAGELKHGLPLLQPTNRSAVHTAGHLYGLHTNTGTDYATTTVPETVWPAHLGHLNSWWGIQQNWVATQYWHPTVYGFTDFISGARPWGHKGWSAWSLPADLIDPMWSTAGTAFPAEGASAEQQILSGMSGSMGLHWQWSWSPNTGMFSMADVDMQQSLLLTYDFGQSCRWPANVASGKSGTIIGIIKDNVYVAVTPHLISGIAEISAWMQTNPESPFLDLLTYGSNVVEGWRIQIPTTLTPGIMIDKNLSIVLDMSAASGIDRECHIVEPFFLQPNNLVDPQGFTVTPPGP